MLDRIAAKKRGQKHKDEVCDVISYCSKEMWQKRIKAGLVKKVQNITTGKVYDTITEVSTDGFRRIGVHRCLSGIIKTHHGCEWKYHGTFE